MTDQIFSDDETAVFTHVVTLAEKAGKHVELMVVPGSDPYEAVVQTAARLQSSRIVMGLSPKLTPSEQGARGGRLLGAACPSRGRRSRSKSCWRTRRTSVFFNLGPHPPRLWPEDIDLAHRLWLELSAHGARARSCTTATSSAWRCAAWIPNCTRTAPTKSWTTSCAR